MGGSSFDCDGQTLSGRPARIVRGVIHHAEDFANSERGLLRISWGGPTLRFTLETHYEDEPLSNGAKPRPPQ